MWPGGFPLYLATAHGARLTDIDGNIFTDFCLGDTGAMAGHSPAPVQAAVAQRYGDLGGATAMLPTEDAAWVAAELARRFGPTHWSFTLSATDANRWALRMVRQITGRPKMLVYSYCYHGSVDESFIVATPQGPRSRPGNTGAPVDPTVTTSVVEFNDIAALEHELARGDIAAVLMEPAHDQHRHRAARARLPGRGQGADQDLRHAADQRRDAHLQRGPRRLHPCLAARS